jgi:NitT/TauT family transport system permease protein
LPGWLIFENRNTPDAVNIFAGLFTVTMLGVLEENVVFSGIEKHTVRRWDMQICSPGQPPIRS